MLKKLAILLAPDGAGGGGTPATPPAATPAATPTSTPDNPFSAVDDKLKSAAPAPPEPPKPEPKPGSPAPGAPAPKAGEKLDKVKPSFKEPKELRAELDRVSGELQGKAKAISDLEAKIAQYEKQGKDVSALIARQEALEKQLEAKEGELRAARREISPEFEKQYETPFNDAAEYAKSIVEQLTVSDPENPDQPGRGAKWEDFVVLYNIPVGKAVAMATEMFGPQAQLVIGQLTELHRLDAVRKNALKAEQDQWKERETKDQANLISAREKLSQTWEAVNKDLTSGIEGYRDAPEDKEASELRQEGYRIVDTMPESLQERIVKDAHVRQRAAAYGPLQLKVFRLTKENESLKTELGQLKNPQPSPGRPAGEPAAPADEPWEEMAAKRLAKV